MLFALAIIFACQQTGPALPPPNPGGQQQEELPPPDPVPPQDSIDPALLEIPPAPPGFGPVEKPYPPVKGKPVNRPIELSPKAQTFIRDLLLIAIPAEFDDEKKWGGTKKVQSGISIRLKRGKLDTHRKWKEVNHGRWQKYNIRMIEPEKRFKLRIDNVVKTAEGPYHFDISCLARLRVQGRWQNWRLGVPLLRISTEAVVDVRLDSHCELAFEFDYSSFPPSVQLKPVVHKADIRIGHFDVRRISHIKGTVAQEFSGAIKSVLTRELAKRRQELPRKLNKKIAKKQDDLKISAGEWLKFSGEDKAAKKSQDTKKQ